MLFVREKMNLMVAIFMACSLIGWLWTNIASAGREAYYEELEQQCAKKRSIGCCMASVKTMEGKGYKLIPGDGCPDGYVGSGMLCVDSYRWCEPGKHNPNIELHVIIDENVDVEVFVDGKIVASEQFRKQKRDFIGIAPHKVFQFRLEPGKHVLTAKALKDDRSFKAEFAVSKNHWLALYYQEPQGFSLEVFDHPVMYQ